MTESKTIDIISGRLFPFHFMVLGVIFFIAGGALFSSHPVISIILMVIAAIILSSYSGTQIIPSSKTYREYNSFLFIKNGQSKKYDGIEKIFINSGKVSQKVYTAHTLNSSTFKHVEYNAYLKFTNGTKIFLASDKNKIRLVNKVNAIARKLNTLVTDSTAQPVH